MFAPKCGVLRLGHPGELHPGPQHPLAPRKGLVCRVRSPVASSGEAESVAMLPPCAC